jgi:hypothetical protein
LRTVPQLGRTRAFDGGGGAHATCPKQTAPFDGVITRKYADVGDLATPGKPTILATFAVIEAVLPMAFAALPYPGGRLFLLQVDAVVDRAVR